MRTSARVALEYQRAYPSTVREGFPMRARVRSLHQAVIADSRRGADSVRTGGSGGIRTADRVCECGESFSFARPPRAAGKSRCVPRWALRLAHFSQLIAESLVFAVLAALAGLAIAYACTRVLVTLTSGFDAACDERGV